MPEGDTVWRTARALDSALTGARITLSDFRVPALAEVDLRGLLVNGTVARGKHLLTSIGDDHVLHSHLKMEGAWHLYRSESRWQRPVDQARVVLRTPRWIAVGFSLGILDLLPAGAADQALSHLGPDLLGDDWSRTDAVARLAREPERSIGEALLDQRNLAGIGNLYRSELCFLTGILPTTPVGKVSDLGHLVDRAKALLEANKQRRMQTTTGNTRHGHQHWVYGRNGQPCQRCGTTVVMEMLGTRDRQRAAYWCPSCQT